MSNADTMISCFPVPPAAADLPTVMPSPFANQPHALAMQASLLLQQRLAVADSWPRDFFSPNGGKMFGVLVVQQRHGAIGFLSAFSGMMNGQWQYPGFVPPIFDQLEHDSFLPAGKADLLALSAQIQSLEASFLRSDLAQQIAALQQQRDQALAALKQRHKAAKAVRKQQRLALAQLTDPADRHTAMAALALASQHHKREATNTTLHWQQSEQQLLQQQDALEQQISQIKAQRTEKSRALHKQVFASYQLMNALDEQQPITSFFADATPPAGAGDCAGAKLIHFAHKHRLKPLALAEFWWGSSPAAGVRHHGHYYPACRGKCRPILPFMLRGLNVEAEPSYGRDIDTSEPQIVYADDALWVINKPAGLMSTPGKQVADSVYLRMLQRYPEYPQLTLVHRLDMGTSGLLLVAKNLRINKLLQKQFIQHQVEKRYEALLSKSLAHSPKEGLIDLPLRVDLDDRPRQLVCYELGRAAKTRWQIIAHEPERTRVWFYPLTGRTHQLRVHAAHRDGLHAAIVGDGLYGLPGERLMLHAQRLCFNHPVSRERMEFELPAPF